MAVAQYGSRKKTIFELMQTVLCWLSGCNQLIRFKSLYFYSSVLHRIVIPEKEKNWNTYFSMLSEI